jgi:hypothetical protein
MVIRVSSNSALRLEDGDNFKAFKVLTDVAPRATAEALIDTAEVIGDYAWVFEMALREFAPQHPAWQAGVTTMIESVRPFGWIDETGRIRAHIQRSADSGDDEA